MQNIDMKVTGKRLVITVDLAKEFGPSKTGRSTIIATTSGNQTVPGQDGVMIGLNIYRKIG